MGFRLIRIGNKSVGEVKTLSFRRSLRNSAIIIYVIALFAAIFLPKLLGYDIPKWVGIVVSALVCILVGIIDKQLPSRRWKNLGILLGIMGTVFLFFLTRRVMPGTTLQEPEICIFGVMILLAYGYSTYCLWRWMRNIMWYKDLILQRELRARRRRRTY